MLSPKLRFWLLVSVFSGLGLTARSRECSAWAKGRVRSDSEVLEKKQLGKKVIQLAAIRDAVIEMPGRYEYHFGKNLQNSLSTKLTQGGKYLLMDAGAETEAEWEQGAQSQGEKFVKKNFQWPASITPLAQIRFHIQSLNFLTRTYGEKTFYGFDERLFTPFNDGTLQYRNEFSSSPVIPPLDGKKNKSTLEQDQKKQTENHLGNGVWNGDASDSEDGVLTREDLESGFDELVSLVNAMSSDQRSMAADYLGFNIFDSSRIGIFTNLFNFKFTKYRSRTRIVMNIEVFSPANSQNETRFEKVIEIQGDGYFFSFSGSYQKYQTGISIETDAMEKTLEQAVAQTSDEIDQVMGGLPMLARVDGILRDGTILLGTGPGANVKPGTLFRSLLNPSSLSMAAAPAPIVMRVLASQADGSLATLAQGNLTQVESGLLLQEVLRSSAKTGLVPITSKISLRFIYSEISQSLSKWIGRKISETLPGGILRYFKYDLPFQSEKEGGAQTLFDLTNEPWAYKTGLDRLPLIRKQFPIVAIIDSGMDYNHPILHPFLWQNLKPHRDTSGRLDRYGWNFISNDFKPYDSGHHGTQLASLVAAVAPGTQLLPIKVFDSEGRTTSAAIYAAFIYAVDHGAQIILCGWSTPVASVAIEMGVAYAHAHGAIVVTESTDSATHPTYPAALSSAWDNVLTVAAVTQDDELVLAKQLPVPTAVQPSYIAQIAAPGERIRVARPGSQVVYDTTTGLAAAITSGALSRILALRDRSGTYLDWLNDLFSQAQSVPDLRDSIPNGARLYLKM